MNEAIAIDLGATSVRFARGRFDGEHITFEVVRQEPNAVIEDSCGPTWDADFLLQFCRSACELARTISPKTTVGLDSWGVDHGFFDENGRLAQPPSAYRDPRHQAVFEEFAPHRERLFALTGIAHQPFNTIYQLIARGRQNPELRAMRWRLLPELLLGLLGADAGHELTQSSTTQLMGLDGAWSEEAFGLAGWPVPDEAPQPPGTAMGYALGDVPVVRVGGHDTASAVLGLGTLEDDEAFLNVGTWSLLGCIVDQPIVTQAAEAGNFTNERSVDGRVRFLKNIPGFYIVNRLHEELGVRDSVRDWIAQADQSYAGRIDPLSPEYFNPESMLKAVRAQLNEDPPTSQAWGGVALMSLCECTARQLDQLETIVGRKFAKLRVAGGGSNSRAFCEALANTTGRGVLAGPAEATVLGNLGAQFLAQGAFASWAELGSRLRASLRLHPFFPGV